MALFARRENPPLKPNYADYKPFLRRDFRCQCAYCERTEEYLGGEEAFEVEHFKPKSKFPDLARDYRNFYYSCRGCNGHIRLDRASLRRWRHLREEARHDLPKLAAVVRLLEQVAASSEGSDRADATERLGALTRRIEESKRRFSIE